MPEVTKNDFIFPLPFGDDITRLCSILVFKESIWNRWDLGNDKKYQPLYWRIFVSGICGDEYLGIAILGLFGGIAAYIINLYLDDDFILYDFKRESYKEEGLRSSVDIGWGNIGVNVKQ